MAKLKHREAALLQSQMTYIEYLEYLLGEQIDDHISASVRSLSVQRLARFREDYHIAHEQFRSFVLATTEGGAEQQILSELKNAPRPYNLADGVAGECRPVLHGRITRSALTFGGDEGHPWESADDSERLDKIKRYLLYAHRIVLPDPIWYIMQYLWRPRDYEEDIARENDFVSKSRKGLAHFLRFLHTIKPLVNDGTISFYPQYEHTFIGFPQALFKAPDLCKWYGLTENRTDHELTIFEYGHHLIIELLFYCNRNQASCLLDNPALVPILGALVQFGDVGPVGQVSGVENFTRARDRNFLQRLVESPLPTLATIAIEDIVAVRRDSEGFNQWRRALRDAIMLIESGQQSENIIRGTITDALAEGRNSVQREMEKSGFLARAKDQTAKFVIGSAAVGAAISAMMGNPVSAIPLVAAAGSGALFILKDWFAANRDRATQGSLMRHYAIWDQ